MHVGVAGVGKSTIAAHLALAGQEPTCFELLRSTYGRPLDPEVFKQHLAARYLAD